MQKNNIDDKLFDAVYKVAAEEALTLDIEEMSSNEELNASNIPSPALNKKVKKIISKYDRKIRISVWKKNVMKTVAGFAMIIFIASTVLLSVEATREFIFNAIIKLQEDHFSIEHDDNIESRNAKIFKPTYIPENYEELSINYVGDIVIFIYQNDNGERITFKQFPSEATNLLGDHEDKNYVNVTINGQTAYLFEANNIDKMNMLIWEIEGTLFNLSSETEIFELMSIAKSIKK